jgi:Mg/Co/Ni transporter MgtE
VLGVLALAALIWVAVEQFGIPHEEILSLFIASVLVLLVIVAAAAVGALLWVGLRRLRRDRH